jgi:hypothetical protein
MTKARINKAIQHLGIKIVGNRGAGYFYFVDIAEQIGQVGQSVMVCYLHQQSLQRWVSDAEYAFSEYKAEQDRILTQLA